MRGISAAILADLPVPLNQSLAEDENQHQTQIECALLHFHTFRNTRADLTTVQDQALSDAIGRGGVGNILEHSRARATSHAPNGATQTASIISDIAESNADYERSVIRSSEEAAKTVVSSTPHPPDL